MPAPGQPGGRLPGSRKTFGPVPVPPPLRPVLPSPVVSQGRPAGKLDGDSDDGDETTVDPQASMRDSAADVVAVLGPPPPPAPPLSSLPRSTLHDLAPPPIGPPTLHDAPAPQFSSLAPPPAPPIMPLAPAGQPAVPELSTEELSSAELMPADLDDDAGVEVDIDAKSTTTETVEGDSGEILLEPPPDLEPARLSDHLASGTGETGGASLDELTEDSSSRSSAPLTVVPGAPPLEAARSPLLRRHMEPQPSSPALSPAWLVVQSGTDRGRRFALRSGRTSVGRGVDNDVVLTDIAVSRKHLTIEFDGATYILHDLGSGNGTLVNSRDEDGAYRLSHGDKLELGNTVLVFECTAAGLQPQALGKWSGAQDDDEPSTVAGRKSAPVAAQTPREHPRPLSAPPPLPRPGPRSAPMAAQMPPAQQTAQARPTAPGHQPAPRMGHNPAPYGAAPSQGAPMSLGGGPSFVPPSPALPRPHRASSPPPPVRGSRPPPLAPAAPPSARTISTEAAIALANRHMPAPSTGGFAPFAGGPGSFGGPAPRPGQPLSYPSAPGGFQVSPSTASSPRFQYPNGVMAPLSPASERRRVLIGILGLAFVAVGAGIVMALVYGGGETATSQAAANPPARAAVPGPDTAAPAAEAQPAAIAAAEPPAAPGSGQPSSPALLQHLYGDQELRPVDFGTDEQFLAGIDGAPAGDGPTPTATAVTEDGEQAGGSDEQEEDEAERDERRRRREARRRAREAEAAGADTGSDEAEAEAAEPTDSAEVGADTALRRAATLYRHKRFDEAADMLRSGAEATSGRSAARMRELAVNYAKIGALLSEGQETTVSDAPRALRAFRDALRLDEEFGDGVHDRAIGARIAQVAPAAAAAFMARKDYAEAKKAADVADKFGAGARVESVRGSLERKATQLLVEARSQAEAGDTEQAADTARQVMRMVPRSSELYVQASKLVE